MKSQVNKLNFTGQNFYVGVDIHKKKWKVSIEHEMMPVKTFVQDPEPDILSNHLKRNYPGATYHTAYEASYCGFWIHYRLKELGINSIVVNAADIPTTHKEKTQKEDKRDSKKIAKCLRNGNLTPIYVPPVKTIQDRGLIRMRYTLAKEKRRVKNRIQAFLLFHGIKCPEEFAPKSGHWSKKFISWLESLSFERESAAYSLSVLIGQLKAIKLALIEITKEIRKLARTPDYKRKVDILMSIPGIGLITAMLLITELDDINRFKSLDRLCSYIGLVPSTHSSGENDLTGEITPRRHNALRTAIIESSWIAIRHDPALLMKYNDLCKKMESEKAIIRIAKKLTNRIRFVMKNEKEYVTSTV